MKFAILTGGGDVPPLNSVIFSARDKAVKSQHELIGFINGWQGVLEKRFIPLGDVKDFSHIGGTFLKSSRINLLSEENNINKTNSVLKDLRIDGLIVIGGDDSLSNSYYISEVPCVLISKTIDNDVGDISDFSDFSPTHVINYFTLGYPTAVNKIISYVSLEEGIRTTAFSHERIIILESMGMHTGWLALASGLGKPDFIIIPEFPLNYEEFCSKLIRKYNSQKHAIVVIAEGSKLKDKGHLGSDYEEIDDFGHPRFGGSSYVLRDMLKRDLQKYFNTRNINAVNPSYLYRSGKPNNLDFSIAQKIGEMAIDLLFKNLISEPVLLSTHLKDGSFNIRQIPLSQFPKTKEGRFPRRYVDSRFYDSESFQITSDCRKYLSPLVEGCNEKIDKRSYFGIY